MLVQRAYRAACTIRSARAGSSSIASNRSQTGKSVGSDAREQTALAEALARRIRFGAPLTVAEYMRECLTHPKHGYYTSLSALGARGDFITSPEISQVFGELVGVWGAQVVIDQKLDKFRLVELGAGSGALLRDALRALKQLRQLPVRVDIVDASPTLRKAQKRTLANAGVKVYWHDALGDALDAHNTPTVVVGQEFLDALPVHVLHATPRRDDSDRLAWRERLVDIDEKGALQWAIARGATPASTAATSLLNKWGTTEPTKGEVLELALEAIGVVERVATHVGSVGGAALFIDYAVPTARVDTLRAYRAHTQVHPLTAPGTSDLTVDVNFEHLSLAVASLASPVRAYGPVTQRELLLRLGIAHRFRALARAVIDDNLRSEQGMDAALAALQANYHSLVDHDNMGGRYSALAVLPESTNIPPAFA